MSREQRVLEIARDAGFDLAGIAPFEPPPRAPEFRRWLEAGRHGEMAYLERDADRITEPARSFPEGKSLLVVGFGHSRGPVSLADGARIARYAAGRDYHNLVRKRLRRLAKRLRVEGLCSEFDVNVDAGPLLERSHAARAGIGFESKAANLLHPAFGPWFFLGELALDVELAPTAPVAGSCGTCTACLDACPTSAIVAPGEVDARRCISYLTIERPGAIPPEHREALGGWVFGCDVCSEVCPWGRRAPDLAARFGIHPAIETGSLVAWVRDLPELSGSPLQRPGAAGLARSAIVALGNRPSEEGRTALLQVLRGSPDAERRESAGWSLARGHGNDAGVRQSLESALAAESDELARERLRRWRDLCP